MKVAWFRHKLAWFGVAFVLLFFLMSLIFYIDATNLGAWPSLPLRVYRTPTLNTRMLVTDISKMPEQEWISINPWTGFPTSLLSRETWFRFDLPASQSATNYVIDVMQLQIRDGEFFLHSHKDGTIQRLASTSEPSTWYWPTVPSIRIGTKSDTDQTVYLRVDERAVWAIIVAARTESIFLASLHHQKSVITIVYGALIGTALACLVFLFILRQLVFAYLSMLQLGMLLWLAMIEGQHFRIFSTLAASPIRNQIVTNVVLLVATLFGVLAVMQYFHEVQHRLMRNKARFVGLLTAGGAVLLPVVPLDIHDHILGLIYPVIVAVLMIYLPRGWYLENVILIGFMTSGLWPGIVATFVWSAGYISRSHYLQFGAMIGTSWMTTVLMVDIARRLQALQRERATTLEQLRQATDSDQVEHRGPATFQVSIMFIDMVGFSTVSETVPGEKMFRLLSSRMLAMIAIIEQHLGVVDRSLGDGLLCYFPDAKTHHALRAWRAACEIQKMMFDEALASDVTRETTINLPLRIGIHTDQVLLGNVGGGQRIDFTMVGQGVTFANRLEQACAPHRIMISADLHAMLLAQGVESQKFLEVQIPIKNQPHLVRAFEHDPYPEFFGSVANLSKFSESKSSRGRRDARYAIRGAPIMLLTCQYATFRVVEFSLYGFKAVSSQLLAHGSIVELKLDTGDYALNSELTGKLLDGLTAEVRWSRGNGGRFEHGFAIIGESPAAANFRQSVLLRHPGAVIKVEYAA